MPNDKFRAYINALDAGFTAEERQKNAVFACFGSAAQHGQHFELALAEFLSLHNRIVKGSMPFDHFQLIDVSLQKKTMGMLLRDLMKRVKFSDDHVEARLDDALDKRNFLIHHFFREKEHLLGDEDGRWLLIQELLVIENALDNAGVLLRAMRIALSETISGLRGQEGVEGNG